MYSKKVRYTNVIIEPLQLTQGLIREKAECQACCAGRARVLYLKSISKACSPIYQRALARDYIFDVLATERRTCDSVAHKMVTINSFRPEPFDFASGRMSPSYCYRARCARSPSRVYSQYPPAYCALGALLRAPSTEIVQRHRKPIVWDHENGVLVGY